MKKQHPAATQRRDFLKHLLAGSAVAVAAPAFTQPVIANTQETLAKPAGLPDETYWQQVKSQFAVPAEKVMFNAANLCPSPRFISQQVAEKTLALGTDVSSQQRRRFADIRQQTLQSLSEFLSVSRSEVGITRNTTESNNIIVSGLDLKPGDEVLLWDQNHPSNNLAWEARAKRAGFTVRKVAVPDQPQTAEELIAPFVEAITAKTRLISVSHISNVSGLILPVREICAIARERNILSMVDAAQSFGLLDINLSEMDCDFFTASTHKWLMGPLENGVLYVKESVMSQLWPLVVGSGWKDITAVDEKYCKLGQRNEIGTAAIKDILSFHNTIGKGHIETRSRQLGHYLQQQIRQQIPKAVIVTPSSPLFSAAVVVIRLPEQQPAEVVAELYNKYSIAVSATGGIRLAPHIYNTLADIDKVVNALMAIVV